MLLTRKSSDAGAASSSSLVASLARGVGRAIPVMDRRAFLRRSGLGVGAGLAASQLTLVRKARAADAPKGTDGAKVEVKRTVCGHCSVGCAIDAVVENGVWVRQEPVFDSPINLGAHCAKGASVREHGITHDSHRLKYPMKLEAGKWKRVSWDFALDRLARNIKASRDRTFVTTDAAGNAVNRCEGVAFAGGAAFSSEEGYLAAKVMRGLGVVYLEQQARV